MAEDRAHNEIRTPLAHDGQVDWLMLNGTPVLDVETLYVETGPHGTVVTVRFPATVVTPAEDAPRARPAAADDETPVARPEPSAGDPDWLRQQDCKDCGTNLAEQHEADLRLGWLMAQVPVCALCTRRRQQRATAAR